MKTIKFGWSLEIAPREADIAELLSILCRARQVKEERSVVSTDPLCFEVCNRDESVEEPLTAREKVMASELAAASDALRKEEAARRSLLKDNNELQVKLVHLAEHTNPESARAERNQP